MPRFRLFAESSLPLSHSQITRCLWMLQQSDLLTRRDLIDRTGLSQPTISRIVQILMDAGLVEERPDLIIPSGPGRPTIPLDLAPAPWAHAAVVVDTRQSYITLYDTHRDSLSEEYLPYNVSEVSADKFTEGLQNTLHRQINETKLPLSNIGVIITGRVTNGAVYNAEWGWDGVPLQRTLAREFNVPTYVESLAVGNVFTEFLQHPECVLAHGEPYGIATLSAGDTVVAAWTTPDAVRSTNFIEYEGSELLGTPGLNLERELCTGEFLELMQNRGFKVSSIPELVALADDEDHPQAAEARMLLDERARVFGTIAGKMTHELHANLITLTGRAFDHDQRARFVAAETVSTINPSVRVKNPATLIRPQYEAASAIAVYSLFSNPVAAAQRVSAEAPPGALRRSNSRGCRK